MRAAFFNFYLYMLTAACLLTVALAREEIYQLPPSTTLICFFLSLIGILLTFFALSIEEEPPSSLMRYSRALSALQVLLVSLGLLIFFNAGTGFVSAIIVAFPAICIWLILEAAY